MREVDESLRRVGLKATLPRLRILEVIQDNQAEHLSAENVYRKLIDLGDHIGLATVYRVLAQFEDAGLVIRHNIDSGADLFELAPDKHHDHMICTRCGKVFEFNEPEIERLQEEVAARLGMRLTGHAHYLYGECQSSDCEVTA